MFGIGGFELFLIVLFAFMLFGPEKIPVFLKTLRKAVTKFREAEQEVSAALKQEIVDPETGETAADVLDSLTGKSTGGASQRSASSESFAARKARHERERAEREQRERERAEREKAAAEQVVQASESPEAPDASQVPEPAASQEAPVEQAAKGAAETTIGGISIEELYSMKPVEAVGASDVPVAADDAAVADATEAVSVGNAVTADEAGKEA